MALNEITYLPLTHQVQNNQNQQSRNIQQFVLTDTIEEDIVPSAIIEETIIEDARSPQQVSQAIIVRDGTITHRGASPLNVFHQPDHLGWIH